MSSLSVSISASSQSSIFNNERVVMLRPWPPQSYLRPEANGGSIMNTWYKGFILMSVLPECDCLAVSLRWDDQSVWPTGEGNEENSISKVTAMAYSRPSFTNFQLITMHNFYFPVANSNFNIVIFQSFYNFIRSHILFIEYIFRWFF